jgi:hypothetical protein
MHIEFIPIAEASVNTLMQSINRVILNPLILLLFSAALVYFLYGVVQYLISPEDEELRTTSKSHMLYGVIGMFIMMSVFGIMRLILNSFGENRIRITDTGEISVSSRGYTDIGNPIQTPPQTDPTNGGANNGGQGGNQNGNSSNIKSPFKGVYTIDDTCWRVSTGVYGQSQQAVLTNVEPQAKKAYADYYKIDISKVPAGVPMITTETGVNQDQVDTSTNPPSYYRWYIAYAPKPGLSLNCAVAPMAEKDAASGVKNPVSTFVNSNPFAPSDYQDSNNYYNESDFFAGDIAADLSSAAVSRVATKIKTDIAPKTYDVSAAIIKTKPVKDPNSSKVYYWALISYPKASTSGGFGGGGSGGGGGSPTLKVSFASTLTAADVPEIGTMQTKYIDTAKLYQVVASGMSSDSNTAEDIAISNGKIMLANKSGKSTLSGINTLEAHQYKDSKNMYHYWMAFSMAK